MDWKGTLLDNWLQEIVRGRVTEWNCNFAEDKLHEIFFAKVTERKRNFSKNDCTKATLDT